MYSSLRNISGDLQKMKEKEAKDKDVHGQYNVEYIHPTQLPFLTPGAHDAVRRKSLIQMSTMKDGIVLS